MSLCNGSNPLGRLASAIVLGLSVLLAQVVPAHAASNKGTISGKVTDEKGAPMAGVTVVAQGPQGELAEITDEQGLFTITDATPGTYMINFFVPGGDRAVLKRQAQIVADQTVRVNGKISTEKAAEGVKEQVERVEAKAPSIDVGSTKKGSTYQKEYLASVPQRSRSFESVLENTPGASGDDYGVSLGGAQSIENNYVIDGVNVTSVGFGRLGTSLAVDFVQELEVITGGYKAEYGRATGGIVNVVTKSGSNEFHGSVATHYEPGWGARARPERVTNGAAMVFDTSRQSGDYNLQLFADLGGPIIKDKLFFYVGLAPTFIKTSVTRRVSRQVDRVDNAACRTSAHLDDPDSDRAEECLLDGGVHYNPDGTPYLGDGNQDFIDGEYVTEDIPGTNKVFEFTDRQLQFNTKLSFLVTPDHTLDVSYFGNPGSSRSQRLNGTPTPQDDLSGSHDISARWMSKLFDKKFQVEALATYHRERDIEQAVNADGENSIIIWNTGAGSQGSARTLDPTPGVGFGFDNELYGVDTLAGCIDRQPGQEVDSEGNVIDPYPLIPNCPVPNYGQGGLGFMERTVAQRFGGRLSGRHLGLKAGGVHDIKYGWDPEINKFDNIRRYTGAGALMIRSRNLRLDNYANDRAHPVTGVNQSLATPFRANTTTINHGFFLQDDWQVIPGQFTLNLGVRLERQDIRDLSGESGLVVSWNTAPRIGFIVDPTGEGKSKMYGSFARFYESIPMDINNRAFGREGTSRKLVPLPGSPGSCTGVKDPGGNFVDGPALANVDCSRISSIGGYTLGGANAIPMPDLKGQYKDEWTVGGEYEVIEDLVVGASFSHSRLGSVIEDASVDGAEHYFIVNPGEEVSDEQVDKIEELAREAEAAARAFRAQGDLVKASEAETRYEALANFAGVAKRFAAFPKAERDFYQATLSARKRFSRNWQVQASYTYARTFGNYGGLYSAETGQLDPNITSQFDLPDLLPNRVGPLGADQPHSIKIDGSYDIPLGDGKLGLGASFRINSGTPQNALGAHAVYGADEAYVLPRGTVDRLPVTWRTDLQLQYGHKLAQSTNALFYLQLFNIFNNLEDVFRDDTYTGDFVNPIINGRMSDLKHLRTIDDESAIATVNPNWRNWTGKQTPFYMRMGLKLEF